MPIVIKDLDWQESESKLTVKIPLRGVHPSKVDVLLSDFYVKTSFEQFFCEIFLLHRIVRESSLCTLTSDRAVFELTKFETGLWGQLEADLSKTERQDLKKRYIDEEYKRIQEEHSSKQIQKSELKRLAVQEQMNIDAIRRQTIDDVRNEEKKNALKDMNIWVENNEKNSTKINDDEFKSSETIENERNCSETLVNSLQNQVGGRKVTGTKILEISEDFPTEKYGLVPKPIEKKSVDCIESPAGAKQPIGTVAVVQNRPSYAPNRTSRPITQPKNVTSPPIRKAASITVDFTPRTFPTPCRESRLEEENEWLRRQAEARRASGFVQEDLRPEERDPQYLKAKGDDFLRNGNCAGAISAYSFAIRLNGRFVDLYVARSEAHMLLGNYSKAASDCSEALDLLKPPLEINLRMRALCIGRRGQALIKLGLVEQGVGELKASLRLVANEELSAVLQKAEEMLEDARNQSASSETDQN